MSKRKLVFETQSKRYFEGPEPGSLLQDIREGNDNDDAGAVLNNRISEYLMQGLMNIGVPTHFIRRINMRESLVHALEMLPFEICVRNRIDHEMAEKLDLEKGLILPRPIIEYHFENKNGAKTLISEEHLLSLGWVSEAELEEMRLLAIRVNDYLAGLYWGIGFMLIDTRIEMGRQHQEDYPPILMIGDDIGPKKNQLWDITSPDEDNIIHPELREVAERMGMVQSFAENKAV